MKTINKNAKIAVTCLSIFAGLVMSTKAFSGQVEINQIEEAASVLNVAELKVMSESFAGYDKGLGLYRLGLSHSLMGDNESAKVAIDASIVVLEELAEEESNNVEVKALLAQVYGFKISLEPLKGAYYGMKSSSLLNEAESLAASNPRVQLVKGIAKYNTPPMFGGGQDDAKQAFEKAIVAFEDDEYSNFHWGEAEAYTWLGLIKHQQGDKASAQADWEKALTINPNYGWPKMLLEKK